MLFDIAGRVPRPQVQPLVAGDPVELGGYEIRGRIGSGGMGAVYLGATRSGRLLAVKVIHPESTGDQEFRARFRREVSAATRVRSRRTAAVIDFDVDAAVPWLATEYIAGPTLAQVVAAHGALPDDAVRELVAGLAEALEAVHREGLVHRDVKPGNVILGPDGPVLIDLGIVAESEATSLTTTGLQPGTPQYMSPEQARGVAVGPASDVWSLGAVGYLAATGRAPFGTGTLAALTYRIVHDEPALAPVPDALRGLIQACLAKDPAARPAPPALLRSVTGPAPGADLPLYRAPEPTGTGTLDDPTQLRTGTAVADSGTTVPDGRPGGTGLSRSRRGLVVVLAAAGLVLAAGGGAAAWHFWGGGGEPSPVAERSAGATDEPSSEAGDRAGEKKPGDEQGKKKQSPKPSSSPSPSSVPTSSTTPASNTTPLPRDPGQEPAGPKTFGTGTVTVAGEVRVGATLTAQPSGWKPEPASRECRWTVGGAAGALGPCSYAVTIGDVGKAIQVELAGSRDGYQRSSVRTVVTQSVPQPQVAQPRCSIYWTAGKVYKGWFGHCDVEQLEGVTYRWQWRDAATGQIVSKNDYETGPRAWIPGTHAGKDVICVVTATREGWRSSESKAAATLPTEWRASA
ncbi:serine/threonine-protein kinase [Myceligenerans crystallogenes]|uniref:serine/threonine-protein kinase n=1 Tax=Myceligenerans crystallogenes TaxID=316335 RepID=UPI0031D916BD